jgi:hypothetical protein
LVRGALPTPSGLSDPPYPRSILPGGRPRQFLVA